VNFTGIRDVIPSLSTLDIAHVALAIAALLTLGLIAQQALRLGTRAIKGNLTKSGEGSRKERIARATSLTSVFSTSLSIVIWLIVGLSILQQLGVDIGPFLASAGIIGLAISFGSQELVKDIISGLFFLVENQFNNGDTIQVNDKKGTVVAMSLRTITLEDEGSRAVYIIRNSQVGILTRFQAEGAGR
jgi:small conductance mechanosensitive channel